MKKFNLIRKSERKSVGTTLALTVGSPSAHRRYSALKHLTFMLLFLLGSLNVWGDTETYTWTLASGDLGTSETPATSVSKGAPATTWSVDWTWRDNTKKYLGFESSNSQRGLQIGKGTADYGGTTVILSTSGISGTITAVKVNAAIAGSGNAELSVLVGSDDFEYSGETSVSLTTTATNYIFEGSASGDISITLVNKATGKGMYIKAIEVTYAAGGSSKTDVTDEKLSWSAASATVTFGDEPYSLPSLTNTIPVSVSYQSTDETVATISNTGVVSILKAGSTTIKAIFAGDATYNAKTVQYTLTVNKPAPTPIVGGMVDQLSISTFGVTGTGSYAAFTNKSASNTGHSLAVYAGTVARNGNSTKYNIQLNSGQTSSKLREIATSTSGGLAKRVYVTWATESTNLSDRKLTVYGSNTAYNGSETASVGTKIGDIVFNTGDAYEYLDIASNYKYIQIVASSAIYMDQIDITWLPIKSAITIDGSIENGSVGVNGIANLSEVAAGTEVTLTNTPADGYKLTAYDVFKTGESATKVTVTNNKFTMPDYDVTVSATFEVAKVLTSIEITTPASQNVFWVGETFNYDGLVVTAHFDGTTDEVVTPTSVSEPTMNVAGEKTITISYTEGTTTKTANYTIDVKALPTESNPGSVADMIDIWDKLGNQSDMYVRGTIYQINGFYSGKYITYWITDSYDAGAEPNHTNAFELYNGLDFDGASFSAKEDLELGQEVVVKGNLTRFGSSAPYTYEFGANNIIISRPKVLKSIALSGSQPTEFTQGDEFSSEGLVVTATYNYGDNAIVTPTSITGYNMLATGNQTVTVSYTETGVTKTATYGISVAAPDLCEHKATISKGEEVNGTFELSVSGELCLDELSENKTSTVLTASPATHYHLSEVTATVGTVGAISDNSCTISEINANTTITAVFAEDDKATLTFAKGEATGTEDAPENIEDYAGEVTLPACPFTYTGHYFIGWKKGETEEIYQPGAYTITAADVTAGTIAFTAQWAAGYIFEWVADGHGYTDGQDISLVNSEPVAIEFAEGSKYYISDKTARFYNTTSLTITAPTDYVISKIELTTTAWVVNADKGTLVGSTWTGLAEEVVFTATATSKVKSIKIYYKEGVAATLEIDDIELEYNDVVTITPKTVTPVEAASHVGYQIKAGSDDCITLADDQITAKSVTGTATIVATIPDAEGGEYIGTSIEFTVSVSAPDSRKKAKSPNAGFATISGDLNADIAYAAYQGDGTSTPNIKDAAIQLYQRGSGKASGSFVTFTAVKGCKIDQVKITTASKTTHIAYSVNDEALSATTENVTAGSDYLTDASLDATSVSIYCMHTSSDNRLFVANATVYYTGEPAALHHLKLSGEYPTEFEQGAAFDHTGLVVTACYDEGETDTEDVTNQADISTPNMNVAGEQTITVSFGGKTADYTITVNAAAGTDDLTGTWNLVTDAATLKAGMKVIIAQHVENDGAIYTMGDQKSNNRDAVASTVAGTILAPNFQTRVFVLEDAGNGMFALQTSNGKYLSAAGSGTNNYLKEAANYNSDKEKWTITIASNKAKIQAASNNRNTIRYNSGNSIFSCYAEDGQSAIALYARPFDYEREGLQQGMLGTICLPNGGKIAGASIFEIAYMDYEADGTTPYKIYFDEVEGGIMEAGMPYVILANEGSSHLGVYYTDSENKTAQSKKGLVGYMDESGRALAENEYFIYNNMFYYVSAADAASGRIHISKNHAFINLSAVPGYNNEPVSVPAPGRRVSIGNGAPAVATGLENGELKSDEMKKVLINGELFIIRGEKMYDATGRLVK